MFEVRNEDGSYTSIGKVIEISCEQVKEVESNIREFKRLHLWLFAWLWEHRN